MNDSQAETIIAGMRALFLELRNDTKRERKRAEMAKIEPYVPVPSLGKCLNGYWLRNAVRLGVEARHVPPKIGQPDAS